MEVNEVSSPAITELGSIAITEANRPASSEVRVYDYGVKPGGAGKRSLSIAVVDENPERRNAVVKAVRELKTSAYAPRVYSVPWVGNLQVLINEGVDVVLMAVDGDEKAALATIEGLCRAGSVTPMAYSHGSEDDLLIRCMRSGVREFLVYPFEQGVIEEAFSRVPSHSSQPKPDTKKVNGRSFVFLGAKGGSGVTTTACNFAVSLAKETKRSTLLIDLDLPLGDAALNLGIANEFSTLDALTDYERLDPTFLMELVVRHSSGLYLLGAPGHLTRVPAADATIDRLIKTACQAFDYVVVDAGSRLDLIDTHVFDMATTIYLITQVGIAELRNSNRVITGALQPYLSKLEIVLNRYSSALFDIGDQEIARALTRPAQWRIPNDFHAVRDMQNTAEPLALRKSSIQRAIEEIAIKAAGQREEPEGKKETKSLFSGLLRLRRAS